MRILIATSVYPPDIGGTAQFARNIYETWKKQGHEVKVAAYRWESAAPPGLRHFLYLTKILRKGWNADMILVMDTWSVAVPTAIACSILNKKYILRTSNDLLWESYVGRTKDLVLLKDFYGTRLGKLSDKEKIIFVATQKIMRKATAVIFSTTWQRDIFEKAYGLNSGKSSIVMNFCGERMEPVEPEKTAFFAGTRFVKWKNQDTLKEAFEKAQKTLIERGLPDIELDTGKAIYDTFIERMRRSWAVILVSLSEISPNMIFDAVAAGVPFILTKENGILDKVKDAAILVDPLNKEDIAEKIIWLSDPKNRASQAEKVRRLTFKHSWKEIGDEIVTIWKKVK